MEGECLCTISHQCVVRSSDVYHQGRNDGKNVVEAVNYSEPRLSNWKHIDLALGAVMLILMILSHSGQQVYSERFPIHYRARHINVIEMAAILRAFAKMACQRQRRPLDTPL